MGPRREWQDEYTLLCERCGYVIEGLPREGDCPECGKPVGESLPERRVGSLWQQPDGITLDAFFGTWHRTLRHPRLTLDRLRFDRGTPVRYTLLLCVLAGPLLLVFLFLTWLEARGLAFISARHGYRLGKRDAFLITSHGAGFWVLSHIGVWAIVLLASLVPLVPPSGPVIALYVLMSAGVLLILGGFLAFEVFAYLGLRRCKFANRVRPESQRADPAETKDPENPPAQPGSNPPTVAPDHRTEPAPASN